MKRPKFGDWIRGNYASEENPNRDGMFVRVIHTKGRLNPGIWYELTDGNGKFWRYEGKDTTRLPRPAIDSVLVPTEPTPAILAAAAVASWPMPTQEDLALARLAAPIVLMQMDALPGATVESIAAAISTMAPAYRAMIAASQESAP